MLEGVLWSALVRVGSMGCLVPQIRWSLGSDALCCVLSIPQTLQKPNLELKQQLTGHSKRVAGSVTELIQAAEAMKGKGGVRDREGRETLVMAESLLPGWMALCF